MTYETKEPPAIEDDDHDHEDDLHKDHLYKSAQERIAWNRSNERKQVVRITSTIYLVCLILVSIIEAISDSRLHQSFFTLGFHSDALPYTVAAGVVAGLSTFAAALYKTRKKTDFESRRLVEEHNQLQASEAEIARTGELDLVALWAVTQQRLDYYHEIITKQARQSFRNAQIAMITGLVILTVTVPAAVYAKTDAASITVGLLGGIGSTLSGYIGRTFIQSQENAAEHLREYFNQPLEFSRYLTAERLAMNIPNGERSQVIAQLVINMVNTFKDGPSINNRTKSRPSTATDRNRQRKRWAN